ncbi:hypothetical protein HK098_003049 [Nowakowskiella sp. JEL0407]|nr:hypothetical protein HK098_003049 [Nowakowskiella sp. JEL0407]
MLIKMENGGLSGEEVLLRNIKTFLSVIEDGNNLIKVQHFDDGNPRVVHSCRGHEIGFTCVSSKDSEAGVVEEFIRFVNYIKVSVYQLQHLKIENPCAFCVFVDKLQNETKIFIIKNIQFPPKFRLTPILTIPNFVTFQQFGKHFLEFAPLIRLSEALKQVCEKIDKTWFGKEMDQINL